MRHILDWWHISTRVGHIEQALAGIYALRPTSQVGLNFVSTDVEGLRHLIWNGYGAEAGRAIWALTHLASEAIYRNGEHIGPAVRRFLLHCLALSAYLANNESALIDYGTRYPAGRPISSSRAEGMVDEIANTRMAEWKAESVPTLPLDSPGSFHSPNSSFSVVTGNEGWTTIVCGVTPA